MTSAETERPGTGEHQPSDRRLLSVLLAGAICAPLAALPLPFRDGMTVQAALLLAIMASVLGLALWRHGRAALGLPRSATFRWGLGLYTAAALWGTVIGLVAGNSRYHVASQLVSMLFLPLGALAFGSHRGFRGASLVQGAAAATLVWLAAHAFYLGAFGTPGTTKATSLRLVLPSSISFTGVGVLVLLCLIAARRAGSARSTTMAMVAAIILLLAGQSRGAWLATLFGFAWLLWRQPAPQPRRLAATVAAALAAIVGLLSIAYIVSGPRLAAWSFEHGRAAASDSASRAGASGTLHVNAKRRPKGAILTAALPIPAGRAVEVRGHLRGAAGSRAWISVRAKDQSGAVLFNARPTAVGSGRWQEIRHVIVLPQRAESLRIAFRAHGGIWDLEQVELRSIDLLPIAWLKILSYRAITAGRAVTAPVADATLRYRLAEWTASRTAWSQAPVSRWLVGHGLGAQLRFDPRSGVAAGRPPASYLHNYYLFLAFKLGVAGLVALTGLIAMAVAAVRGAARAHEPWLPAAAGAVWVAYLLWSVTSPEILDFRVAPILGALLAAATNPLLHSTQTAQESLDR